DIPGKPVDGSGNESAPVSQTITVVDTTKPVISAPGADKTIECPAEPVFTPPTATDNCDTNPSIKVVSDVTTPAANGCSGAYTRTITWKAVDCSGNEDRQSSES